MDQILHRKLIIEKNNLQLEVAKANKEIAKLMETVQQYEAVLASLDEADIKNHPEEPKKPGPYDSNKPVASNTMIPTKPVLRGSNQPRLRPGKRSVQEATKQLGENGMGSADASAERSANDMDSRRLQRKSGINLGASTGPEGVHVSGDPKVTAAMTQRHMELQKKAGAKPARPHYYINGNPAHVEESTQLDEIITPDEARGSRRALAQHQAARMERILASHNAQANAAHNRAGVITKQFGDKQYDRAQRVADLARRLGANPAVHPGSRGTIDQGYTSQEGSTKSKLRYFEPGSETEQNQAVARMQNRRDERMRQVDQTKFGF
jgi:hypothetical protein